VRWSPGALEDAALAARLGTRALERARELVRRRITVEVHRAAVPTANLPACTVRFHVPGELSWARCDCTLAQDCEHVAVAVWAFREADRRDEAAARQIVDLASDAQGETEAAPLEVAMELARDVILAGVAHSAASLAQRFAVARRLARAAGQVWPHVLLEELEELLASYRERSSRYRSSLATELVAGLSARERSSVAGGALPPGFILGQGEAFETSLDHLRLISLGARVAADGGDRHVSVYLADPDSGTVLVLEKTLVFKDGEEAPAAPALVPRRVAPGVGLGALASGQVVTRVARRIASRRLVLGEARGGMTSVTPQTGDWQAFPEPLRVNSLARLAEEWRSRPPLLLRPRVLAADVHALEVGDVRLVAYEPGRQRLVAEVSTSEGEAFRVVREHRSAAPAALESLASVLSGGLGRVRFISGLLRRRGGSFECDPLAVVADRLVVIDLAEASGSSPVPLWQERVLPDPIAAAADLAAALLDECVHAGLRESGAGLSRRLREGGASLAAVGLGVTGDLLTVLSERLEGAREGGTETDWSRAAEALLDAAIRTSLVSERA
jgi:hypothetical protein